MADVATAATADALVGGAALAVAGALADGSTAPTAELGAATAFASAPGGFGPALATK